MVSHWLKTTAIALCLTGCGGTTVVDGDGTGLAGTSSGSGSTAPVDRACSTKNDTAQSQAVFNDMFMETFYGSTERCGDDACHGGDRDSAANGLYLPLGDVEEVFENLVSYEVDGDAYVNIDAPLKSWINCHLTSSTTGQGRHVLKPDEHLVVEDWLFSGALGPR